MTLRWFLTHYSTIRVLKLPGWNVWVSSFWMWGHPRGSSCQNKNLGYVTFEKVER
jgi:hypothetical protein